MDRFEKMARLDILKALDSQRTLTLAEYHEVLALCEDLGLSSTWQLFKQALESVQRRMIEERKAWT